MANAYSDEGCRLVISEDGKWPIVIDQGVQYSWLMIVRDGDGQRWPLAGFSAIAQVRTEPGGTLLATFDVTVNQAAAGEEGCGEIELHLSSTESAKIDRSAVWDMRRIDGTGAPDAELVAISPVTVNRRVSQ